MDNRRITRGDRREPSDPWKWDYLASKERRKSITDRRGAGLTSYSGNGKRRSGKKSKTSRHAFTTLYVL